MALPRWVLSERVDSSSMALAFKDWRSKNPKLAEVLGLVDGLPIIEHGRQIELSVPDKFKPVPCPRGENCWRCSSRKSGYTFRWFSLLWLDGYKDLRGPGSWLPGEAEGVRTTLLGEYGFQGEIINGRGQLVVEEMGEMESRSQQLNNWIAHRCALYPSFEAELLWKTTGRLLVEEGEGVEQIDDMEHLVNRRCSAWLG